MITCAEAVRRLWDYLDRTLTSDDLTRVEEHLTFCRTCCGEMEFARELQSFLTSQASEEIPEEVKSRLEEFVNQLEES